jgi:hypothetical protein
MSLVFEKLSQLLLANESWRMGIAGDFFRVSGADWPVTVTLYQGGREIGRMVGMQAGDYVRDVAFDLVRIDNGSIQQSVVVQIAGGGVGSDRVVGEVSVIDGGYSRTIAGSSFWAGAGHAGVPGLYSQLQLWMPPASGKVAAVKAIYVGRGVAGGVQLRYETVTAAVALSNGRSKRLSGAASAAALKLDSVGSLAGQQMAAFYIQASATQKIELQEPIAVEPGYGLSVYGSEANAVIEVAFDFHETVV